MRSHRESTYHPEPRAKGHEPDQGRSYPLADGKARVEELQLVTASSDDDGT